MQIPIKVNSALIRYKLALLLAGFAVVVSMLTRIVLLFYSGDAAGLNFSTTAQLFSIGLLYDLITASFVIIPLLLHLSGLNEKYYSGKWILLLPAIGLTVLLVLIFTQLIPADFNKDLRKGVIFYVAARLLIFLLLAWAGLRFRITWRKAFLLMDIAILFFIVLFNAMGEFLFWSEFSNRYNFIAVDYLIYTNEVWGNIKESYPIYTLLSVLLSLSLLLTYLSRKIVTRSVEEQPGPAPKWGLFLSVLSIPLLSAFSISDSMQKFSNNQYANELAGNGLFDLVQAFKNNELDFYRFYKTIPDKEAFAIVRKALSGKNVVLTEDEFSIERTIQYEEPQRKANIVLISVESLSADFLGEFGNTKNITPNLDSIAEKGWLFTNLYASGTRTVRGLEALSLSIPPTPGQSIIKRPGNESMFSLGSVLKSNGYQTYYVYGGDAYFDNMNYFFSHNNYTVKDRDAIPASEIHYENIWGVADEDLFSHTLQLLDSSSGTGAPFFAHVMTVSNHRPFTYPDGRIDIPSSNHSREGGVKYTDYSIGKFLKEAASKTWFNNTVFIVVADHCAGTAGKMELPLNGYKIPMIWYAPKWIQPAKINKLVAQIDIAPSIMSWLHLSYNSMFFGQDMFDSTQIKERAFISTYQKLGYLRNDTLHIQMPLRKTVHYLEKDKNATQLLSVPTDSLEKEAIAFYQVASWMIRNKKFHPASNN
ncbi:LTA synthase family protein [Flavihumibacter sp. UBA7668]|uniref:LTA synthase family protein n=1 Tax=Flavihumibacter sp. UBA7668 TaxID=1946542 RepID=UPI0025C5EBB2|nr:LTA synthase family protein [Flavihumibacter sp. UBA7668]